MKSLEQINKYLDNVEKRVVNELVKVQRKSAEDICENAKEFAPVGKGIYRDSIKVSETKIKDNKIKTKIYSDLTLTAKFNGNQYNLGYLLENGTYEHAIPNAFGFGYTYGYVDRYGIRHKGTMDKDWHPGFRPFPHYIPALLLNKERYNNNIKKVLDKEFK